MKDELQAMKEGLTDIIPTELLAGLTAEASTVPLINLVPSHSLLLI